MPSTARAHHRPCTLAPCCLASNGRTNAHGSCRPPTRKQNWLDAVKGWGALEIVSAGRHAAVAKWLLTTGRADPADTAPGTLVKLAHDPFPYARNAAAAAAAAAAARVAAPAGLGSPQQQPQGGAGEEEQQQQQEQQQHGGAGGNVLNDADAVIGHDGMGADAVPSMSVPLAPAMMTTERTQQQRVPMTTALALRSQLSVHRRQRKCRCAARRSE